MKLPDCLEGTHVAEYAATHLGSELLEESVTLQDVVTQFAQIEIAPEEALRGREFVGSGKNSSVWLVDGVAVKTASVSTGKAAWEYGRDIAPEDLIGQFTFMQALGNLLANKPEQGLVVPEQYFAIRTHTGSYISGQEHMAGWMPVTERLEAQKLTADEIHDVHVVLKRRIISGVGMSALRPGLNDLHLGRYQKLHTDNLLVPQDARDVSIAPVCIIDQPARGAAGRLGIIAAQLGLATGLVPSARTV